MKGYTHVYTGDGKGKTTAALGLALRAAGAGLKVFIAQFVKGSEYSEHLALARFSESIIVKQYGRGFFLNRKPDEEDIQTARKGLQELKDIMLFGGYDLVVLDEADVAAYYDLFSVDDLIDFIHSKPENIELVVTGRMADPRVIDAADLATEMKEIKHYFKRGVKAREGIEK
ncbi:MAG: cob(I)yrinic acid a,c-diamide adenosyltransferase [Desulfatiglans sp.]|jgi:cob(I)alamin adenosyltransferase|nr:cob(I)yrinic acid a,c-diamide adenosyltransferase [Desulfatiglans sp.]